MVSDKIHSLKNHIYPTIPKSIMKIFLIWNYFFLKYFSNSKNKTRLVKNYVKLIQLKVPFSKIDLNFNEALFFPFTVDRKSLIDDHVNSYK